MKLQQSISEEVVASDQNKYTEQRTHSVDVFPDETTGDNYNM